MPRQNDGVATRQCSLTEQCRPAPNARRRVNGWSGAPRTGDHDAAFVRATARSDKAGPGRRAPADVRCASRERARRAQQRQAMVQPRPRTPNGLTRAVRAAGRATKGGARNPGSLSISTTPPETSHGRPSLCAHRSRADIVPAIPATQQPTDAVCEARAVPLPIRASRGRADDSPLPGGITPICSLSLIVSSTTSADRPSQPRYPSSPTVGAPGGRSA